MSGRREQLLELLAETPTDSELLYFLAMESVAEGNDPQAALDLEKILAVDSGHVATHLQLGQVLVRLGEEEKAKKIYSLGMEAAKKAGNHHAYSEIGGFLDAIS
jgi:Tfp pilus assembly protein PilF